MLWTNVEKFQSRSAFVRRAPARTSSIPAGDVVLAITPPYQASPWMGAGLPLIAAVLELGGIKSRLVRFLDNPIDTPVDILDPCLKTLWTDPPLDERLAGMRALAEKHHAFFDRLLDVLCAGPERVFGFSVWRHNVDVALELGRRLKLRRPEALLVLGGPEAAESVEDLARPWVDVVVSGAAEGVVTPVMRACLDGRPGEAAIWETVWINPRHAQRIPLAKKRAETPPIPRIDYSDIVPLFLDDPSPSIPVLLNVGCPFRCGFCTNTSIYPEMEWSTPARLFEEMRQITDVWAASFEGEAPPLHIEMCDATVNAQPAQFDELCDLMAQATWAATPSFHGSFVVDHRVTPERVKRFVDAGFINIFFGLESASPRVRRAMKKPGSIASVAQGLQNLRDAGEGRITANFNIIVGWPDETEAEFYETVAFMEWAATLGVISDASAMPLARTPAVMDTELFAGATGDRKGFAWRSDGPGGDPAVRCRRYLHIFERFHDLLPVTSVLPRRQVIGWMMPDLPPAFLDAWCGVHGEDNLRTVPFSMLSAKRAGQGEAGGESAHAPAAHRPGAIPVDRIPVDLRSNAYIDEVERLLSPALMMGSEVGAGWVLHAIAPWGEEPRAAVLQFVGPRDEAMAAILLEPRKEGRDAYKQTARFNVSYLSEYNERACAADLRLVDQVIGVIAGREHLGEPRPPESPPHRIGAPRSAGPSGG